jgi:hypothetical protein
MRLAGLVACKGERRYAYRFVVGNPEGKKLEDIGVYGNVILESILKEWDGGVDWIDLAQDRER